MKDKLRKVGILVTGVRGLRYVNHKLQSGLSDLKYQFNSDKSLPPPSLRFQVHRSLDSRGYAEVGQRLAAEFKSFGDKAGVNFDGKTILDLGCGPGRMLKPLGEMTQSADIHGCDINQKAISWLKTNSDYNLTLKTIDPDKPFPYDDCFFDVVICNSVFTHLDETRADSLLAEVSRILKPDGLGLLTIHGSSTFHVLHNWEKEILDSKGMYFRVDQKKWFKPDDLPDFYQTSFHTKWYIEEHWKAFVQIESIFEKGIADHQDLVLVRGLKQRTVQ